VSQLALGQVTRRNIYGGKAATLSKLLRAGLPVPPGFVFSWAQFSASQVADFQHNHLRPDGAYPMLAVRSSAVAEDGRHASYAGQFESVLGCYTADEAYRAACIVRESASAARVAAYQARKAKTPPATAKVGVIVQLLVNATHSAVVFTRHPMPSGPSHRTDVVVEVVYGLGDQLVSGRVEPATWEYGRDDKLWAHRAGRAIEIPARDELLHLALRCEKIIGTPADVEAAFDGEKWWIVQARPITTLPKPRRKGAKK